LIPHLEVVDGQRRPDGLDERRDLGSEALIRGQDLGELALERDLRLGVVRLACHVLGGLGGGGFGFHLAAELSPDRLRSLQRTGAGLLADLFDSFLRGLAAGRQEMGERLREQNGKGIEQDGVHERETEW
jgi:hypothetical protein